MKKQLVGLVAGLGFVVASASAISATTIFSDDFNRSVSGSTITFNTVGGSWLELQNSANDVALFYDGATRLGVLQLRDELSGNPDAAASQPGINTTGFGNIQLVFDWKPLSAAEDSDKLYAAFCLGGTCSNTSNTGWTSLPALGLGLGGSGWTIDQTFDLAGAANNAQLNIRFWTDVSSSDEGAYVDNVRVVGTAVSPVPEPEIYAMLLAGLGLMGFVANRKRQAHVAG
jgi:hypothetical protein